jgi:hypothetical protein
MMTNLTTFLVPSRSFNFAFILVAMHCILFSACSKTPNTDDPVMQTLEVNKSSIDFPPSAYTDTLKIQSNASWDITNSPSWIEISGTSGSGNKDIYLTVQENTTLAERTSSITFKWGENSTKTITVKQSIYALVLNQAEYISSGGGQVTITGTGFSPIASENAVTIAGVAVNVALASSTMLVVDIPMGQVSGDLFVTVNSRTSPTAKFTYAWVGTLTVIAGGNGQGYADGPATTSKFNRPTSLILQENGDLLVCDGNNNKIRRISSSGIVSTLPGRLPASSVPGAPITNFDLPTDISKDADGNIYVSENTSNLISKIDLNGNVSIYAGNSQFNSVDGAALSASFKGPTSVYAAADGIVYVTEGSNPRIRKISGGQVTTVAGSTDGFSDGTGTSALFSTPTDIYKHSSGDLLIVDMGNNRIRRMTTAGVVTTFAGNGAQGGNDGNALEATFYAPGTITTDNSGNVFIGDANNKIRWINADGKLYTIPMQGEVFSGPYGIAVNANREIFVADSWNHRICKITLQ